MPLADVLGVPPTIATPETRRAPDARLALQAPVGTAPAPRWRGPGWQLAWRTLLVVLIVLLPGGLLLLPFAVASARRAPARPVRDTATVSHPGVSA